MAIYKKIINILDNYRVKNHILQRVLVLSAAFTQYGCVSCHLIWITRENANYMVTVKRSGGDCDSPKNISFIITNSL